MAIKEPELIWHNGKLIPWGDAKVHVLTHAIHYGSSVFEGIRAYHTPRGTAIFRLEEHVQRLFDSGRVYRMAIPFDKDTLMQACRDVVRENGLDSAYLRPVAFFGYGGLGLLPKDTTPVEVSIAAFEWGAYLGDDSLENGVDVGVTSWNRLAPNTIPTGAKAGGNYLSSILIAGEARRHGYTEGIALDHNNQVSEGAGENIFIVKNGVIYTPPTSSCLLPGITRNTLMTLAKDLGYEVVEQNIQREAMYLADEMFMCGTAAELVPVRSVDGIKVGTGTRGDITGQIQKAFFGLFNGTTEDKWGWLDFV
jgi:branched-chain amino acid aminotransferase